MSKLTLLVLTSLTSSAGFSQTYNLAPYVNGLDQAITMVQDPSKRNVQYVVQQSGLIRTIKDGVLQATPFLDLTAVIQLGSEQGVLGLAFPPDYATSGKFYVNMTLPGPVMQLARYQRSLADPLVADAGSRVNVLRTVRQNANHNAGTIKFGPDGLLYVPMGDGGGTGDENNNSQNPNTWLGKMLRIDPNTDDFPMDNEKNYHVPVTNPFVDNLPIQASKEIWAFGLRNPFKFSFDDPNLLGTGAMIIGDVGQDDWEEIDYQPAGQAGNNYGWRRLEGFSLFSSLSQLAYSPETKPAFVYNHTTGTTIIGGQVYRGLELGPETFGRYFFADFTAGRVWSMLFKLDATVGRWVAYDWKEHTSSLGAQNIGSPVAFEVDSYGELYIVDYNGKVSKVINPFSTWVKEFTVQAGRLASGATRNLVLGDDKFLQIENATAQAKNCTITVFGRSNVVARNALDVDAVGALTNSATGLLRIFLKRWSDGQFVQVSAQNMDSVKRRFRLTNLSAAQFVRNGDGRIELKLDVTKNGTVAGLYRASWDQVLLKVR